MPEPTAYGRWQFRCRGSHRRYGVAQLFSLGHFAHEHYPICILHFIGGIFLLDRLRDVREPY
jgi:hypothetical protein